MDRPPSAGIQVDFKEMKRHMGKEMSRRSFLQTSAATLGAIALSGCEAMNDAVVAQPEKSQVFFTRDISVNGLLKIYSKINQGMKGKTGIKLHTGEPHGPNLITI